MSSCSNSDLVGALLGKLIWWHRNISGLETRGVGHDITVVSDGWHHSNAAFNLSAESFESSFMDALSFLYNPKSAFITAEVTYIVHIVPQQPTLVPLRTLPLHVAPLSTNNLTFTQ
jgi:hypothetical protein